MRRPLQRQSGAGQTRRVGIIKPFRRLQSGPVHHRASARVDRSVPGTAAGQCRSRIASRRPTDAVSGGSPER